MIPPLWSAPACCSAARCLTAWRRPSSRRWDFVRAAHEQGIYVILDVIAHHTGNVFTYAPDRYPTHDPASGQWYNDPRWDGKPYAVQGFNDREGRPTLPFDMPDGARLDATWPDGAIGPASFSDQTSFFVRGTSRAGTTTRSTPRGTCSA